MAVTKLSNSGIATGGVLKYDSMLAGNPAFDPGAFIAIATTTLNSDTQTVTLSSIPQTYKHLMIRVYTKPTNVGLTNGQGRVLAYFNGDSSNYYYSRSVGNARDGASGTYAAQTYLDFLNTIEFWVNNYTDTSITKQLDSISGWISQTSKTGGSGLYRLTNNSTTSTAAVTSITFTNTEGWSFVSGSKFMLYGLNEG